MHRHPPRRHLRSRRPAAGLATSLATGFAALLAVTAAASADRTSGPPSTQPDRPAAALPLLGDDGVHLYVQEAYEGFDPAVTAAVDERYAELVEAGMVCSRHLFDWADLQPDPRTIDVNGVIEAMGRRLEQGTPRQFVNISVVDSFGPEALPPFIADQLAAGVPWDDPQIVRPFTRMLTRLLPVMVDRGAYMIGFANEPGGYYENEPEAAAAFTRFVRAAILHTRKLHPELATTVVFAGSSDASIPPLMPLVDVATFNTYAYELELDEGCTIDGFALPLWRAVGGDRVGALLDQLVDAADGRLICIQEFGQSTGWDDQPETIGPLAGLETQREVMIALAEGLQARRAHFRTVSLWTMNDHTRAGMQYVIDALIAGGLPPCYADNIAEIFGPTGIVRSDETATVKPAFDAVREAIKPLRRGTALPF